MNFIPRVVRIVAKEVRISESMRRTSQLGVYRARVSAAAGLTEGVSPVLTVST